MRNSSPRADPAAMPNSANKLWLNSINNASLTLLTERLWVSSKIPPTTDEWKNLGPALTVQPACAHSPHGPQIA